VHTVFGLASLDLTYRPAVLIRLHALMALDLSEKGALAEWWAEARKAGADGVWLAPGPEPVAPSAIDATTARQYSGVADFLHINCGVIALPESWTYPSEFGCRVVHAATAGPLQLLPAPAPAAPVLVDTGVFDAHRSPAESHRLLWDLHSFVAPGRHVVMMPPPSDVLPTEMLPPAPDPSASVGVWTVAAAQGVRVMVVNNVGAARRAVDTIAEILAGENGPVVVDPAVR